MSRRSKRLERDLAKGMVRLGPYLCDDDRMFVEELLRVCPDKSFDALSIATSGGPAQLLNRMRAVGWQIGEKMPGGSYVRFTEVYNRLPLDEWPDPLEWRLRQV